MDGHPAFDPGDHLILQPDVGKCAAHHDFVIAAPCAVLIEIDRLDLVLDEVFACR